MREFELVSIYSLHSYGGVFMILGAHDVQGGTLHASCNQTQRIEINGNLRSQCYLKQPVVKHGLNGNTGIV